MTLPNWCQVATLHKDIEEQRVSESIFAADLGDVFSGKAPLEYQGARIFFQKTYLANGLTNILLFAGDEDEKGVGDNYELFLKTPGMPVPESENVLSEVIKESVDVYHKLQSRSKQIQRMVLTEPRWIVR